MAASERISWESNDNEAPSSLSQSLSKVDQLLEVKFAILFEFVVEKKVDERSLPEKLARNSCNALAQVSID